MKQSKKAYAKPTMRKHKPATLVSGSGGGGGCGHYHSKNSGSDSYWH